MSIADRPTAPGGACLPCLRRSWLLAELGGVLDCNCRAGGRLLELLELADDQLIAAVGGRRREELLAAYASFQSADVARREEIGEVCRHDALYPPRLRESGVVAMLNVEGGIERLHELATRPVVAFVGRGASSDYGVAIASSLARELAASEVTIAAELSGAIGPAALAGARELEAGTIALVAGGLDVGAPARQRSLLRRVARSGCAISELPCATARRRWTTVGCERTLASLCTVALLVEADDSASGLSGARIASALGRALGAVPGRITSRGSCAANSLLRAGARPITCASDVLELIYEADGRGPGQREQASARADLEPRLQLVLERVGAGCDTPARLLSCSSDEGELWRSLGELELAGLIARGDGGRYILADPLATSASTLR